MANMPNPEKAKFNFSEWTDVLDEIKDIAKELSEKEHREVGLSEVYRFLSIRETNKRRRARGEPELDLDWRAQPHDRKAAA